MLGRTKGRREIIRSLRSVTLFAECTDKELLRIDELLTEVNVSAGKTLIGAGSAALQFMVVCDGYGQVSSDGQGIGRVGPGSHIGARSLYGQTGRANVVALTPMTVLIMNVGELATMLSDVPSVAAKLEEAETPQPAPTRPLKIEAVHA
jgi:CRP-like cAMP-binding protein